MHHRLLPPDHAGALPVWPVAARALEAAPQAARDWAALVGFKAGAGELLPVPGAEGSLAGALLGLGGEEGGARGDAPMRSLLVGALAGLPAGDWRLAAQEGLDPALAAQAFLIGGYRFERYRKPQDGEGPRLVVPDGVDPDEAVAVAEAVALARDLINTPTNDMGPDGIEAAARALATEFGAEMRSVVGDDLLSQNFPMIHAVGRASAVAPRLIDLTWGASDAPKLTLVGKGVAFDTGGLDIKPASAMLLMKKDMGGAANVLALARLVMARRLGVRLRVLVPAVENSISGAAFRPGDVLRSRKGKTVEIGNTDAEGRLVLADALALADEEAPELLIDMATLTGAARVALGPDLPPFYTDDDAFAAALSEAASQVADPVWRLPLWSPYAGNLASKVADINNVTSDGFAGSITAALFLQGFVEQAKTWAHFDIYGWRPKAGPYGPVGGEAQAIRALHALVAAKYPSR
ncbi:leucyl aminopeptidase family protein [Mangrovibrevibacter kandeliae]|uniref:leucyl aminopeptidase family protein n=1 Tax=Mangrovibrevibacter kandeliae TaxID=2968473 RepID=UPI00211823E1|nr:leucyl aminopeptidase family protein [Aurantimonas sp. CSK15Z-1]MCQ8783509.1 leucyl aminopeptidase family protein [Aurantimonas sp. CSK15Z-1]